MSRKHIRKLLLKAGIPFVLLSALVIGLYYWFFSPKSYEDIIPGESKAVVAIDPESVGQAGGFLQTLSAQLDIPIDWLKFDCPVYAFITPNEYYGIAMEVPDANSVKKKIDALTAEKKLTNVQTSDGISFAWIEKGWQVAWSDRALAILGPGTVQEQPDLQQTLRQMFKAKRNQSFRHSDYYDKFKELTGTVRIYSRLNALPTPFNLIFRLNIPSDVDPGRVALYANMDIDKDKKGVSLDGHIDSRDEHIVAALTNFEQQNKPITTLFPEEIGDDAVLFIASTSRNGQLTKLLRSDQTTRSMLTGLNQTIDANGMVNDIAGDFSLIVTAFNKNFSPTFYFQALCASDQLMRDGDKWMDAAKGKSDVSLVREGKGFCLSNKDSRLHFGQDGNMLYFRSQAEAYNGTGNSKVHNEAVGSRLYIRVNLKHLFAQPCMSSGIGEVLKNICGGASTMTYRATDGRKVSLAIK